MLCYILAFNYVPLHSSWYTTHSKIKLCPSADACIHKRNLQCHISESQCKPSGLEGWGNHRSVWSVWYRSTHLHDNKCLVEHLEPSDAYNELKGMPKARKPFWLQLIHLANVHYLWAGGANILRGGHLFLASRRWGGHLFLAWKILKKPAKPIFPRVSGKNKTKNFSENIFLRGGTFFGGLENKEKIFSLIFARNAWKSGFRGLFQNFSRQK